MGGSKNNDEESLLEAIKFYQSGLLRYLERNDAFKMSHGLNKLSSYPIKISHLQDTGVGRTVNLLVKMEGKVGEQARSLIAKWKKMVEDEKEVQTRNGDSHSDASNESPEQPSDYEDKSPSAKSTSESNSSSEEENHHKNSRRRECESNDDRERKRHKSSHETKEHKSSSREKETRTSDYDKKQSSRHEKESSSRHGKDRSSKHEKEHSSKHDSHRSSKHDEKTHHTRDKHESSSRHAKESSSKSEKENSKQEVENSKKKDERHKEKDERHHKEKNDRHHKEKDERQHKEKDRKSYKENEESHNKLDRKERKEKTKSSHREKDESPNEEKETEIQNQKNGKDDDKIKKTSPKEEDRKSASRREKVSIPRHHITEISSSSGTSFEEAMGMFELPRKMKKSNNDSTTSSKQISSNIIPSSSVEPKKDTKSDKKSNANEKPKDKSEKKESSKKDKKSDKKEKGSTSKHTKDETISSESGTSFADALGQMEIPKKEKKSSRKKQECEENSNIEYAEICSSSGASFEEALGMMEVPKKKRKLMDKSAVESPPPVENGSPIVPLPSVPLEKIEVNTNYLPPITPNYRPINITHSQPIHNEVEFMDTFMKNKHHRTKIYSGNKSTLNKVPSLQDFCISLLQLHIDDMEATGGVPYSILKPVLEKATPSQLMRMEYYNSYLTEDSDELWKLHCQKDFKNKTRQECETWREMYNRCTDEREARFLTLTASIKEAKQKSVPVRTTKIAYIDPPMAGSRRSMKQHTAAPMAKAKVEAMVRESKSSSDVVVTHQRKASRSQPAPSVSSQSKVKKMAPLMAKSLSAFKNRRYKK